MSEYADFIVDFTTRSKEVFDEIEDFKWYSKYNVTLLLTFASPCFLIPYDRLKNDATPDYPRPFDDKYKEHWKKLSKRKFKGSPLSNGLHRENIKYGTVKDIRDAIIRNFSDAALKEIDNIKKADQPEVKTIISTIRNGLAHGNIFTTGTTKNIEHIVYAKRKEAQRGHSSKPKESDDNCYVCFIITPSDFKQLLTNWFEWLESKEMYVGPQKTQQN